MTRPHFAGIALALAAASGLAAAAAAPAAPIERSVVRIIATSQRGNWFAPWDNYPVRRSTGSGFVIDGGLVMTNAHVVSDARMLLMLLDKDPVPHPATVVAIGHDCDLALIKPTDAGVLDGIPALGFGGLPALRSTVETYGYPAGGQQISATRGVVSRIELQGYAHTAVDRHLAVQTDAAINPGNSGGPVVQEGKVVGVAFQGIGNLQNVGFFIPAEIVRHFLDDVGDGHYDGFPELGLVGVPMENPAARRRAGMSDGQTGMLVDRVFPQASADGRLRPGDVLLAVEGHAIANDGTVAVDDLRLDFSLLTDRHQVRDTLAFDVLREGRQVRIDVPLSDYAPFRRLANEYDRLPSYFVYGGLVFVPLDREVLKTFGDDWYQSADRVMLHELLQRPLDEPERMVHPRVVLLRRLDHPVNVDIAYSRNMIVEKINGRTVERLQDVIDALAGATGRYHVIEFAHFGQFAVLDREKADAAGPEILARYGITKDRRP